VRTIFAQLLQAPGGWPFHTGFSQNWVYLYNVVPQFVSVQLVQLTSISMVFGRYVELVNGVYKPINITFGGPTL
jgi:hypothetical protein